MTLIEKYYWYKSHEKEIEKIFEEYFQEWFKEYINNLADIKQIEIGVLND